ncbi:Forkhead-associated (FHA) domain [Trinorchestia longiramus]|nr:Forkhead-associated (FHA) domain [Trinorchestia longiramus]
MENNVPQKRSYYYLSRVPTSSNKKCSIIPFKGAEVTVGRSIDNSYVLPDVIISRHHAVFKRTSADSWSVTNLSSSGMLLDGQELPPQKPHPLPLNSCIQFSPGNLYLYKFACKHFSGSKGENFATNDSRNGLESGDQGSSASSSTVPASQSLVEAHDQVEKRLQHSRAAYDQLLRDKQSLTEALQQQKLHLQKKYEEEQLQLQQQLLDEQQQQEVQQAQQQLAQQLHDKVDPACCGVLHPRVSQSTNLGLLAVEELKEKLRSDRTELEEQMQQERTRKEELRVQQEKICQQLQQEKETLQEALQRERLRLQEQVTEKVQEAEKQLQEQLQQVQSRLQHQEHLATNMSKELEKKTEAEQRLQDLETEKERLQQALERAQQDGQQVSSLQTALEQMEKEKAGLQHEMEMMEFAIAAEAKKAVFDSVEEVMDSEMQCPICNELFIKAVLLNCTHTFCEYCIGCWKKKKRDCPSCRAVITSETRSLAIDNFIDKIVLSLSEDMRKNREKTIKEREGEIVQAAVAEETARQAREAARNTRGRRRRGMCVTAAACVWLLLQRVCGCCCSVCMAAAAACVWLLLQRVYGCCCSVCVAAAAACVWLLLQRVCGCCCSVCVAAAACVWLLQRVCGGRWTLARLRHSCWRQHLALQARWKRVFLVTSRVILAVSAAEASSTS